MKIKTKNTILRVTTPYLMLLFALFTLFMNKNSVSAKKMGYHEARKIGKYDDICESNKDCVDNLVCNQAVKKCRKEGENGDVCKRFSDCADSLVCNYAEHKCRKPGEDDYVCRSHSDCAESLVCNQLEYKCRKPGENGYVCKLDCDCKNEDGVYLQCNLDENKCRQKGTEGVSCSNYGNNKKSCKDGLVCNYEEDRCRKKGKTDDVCAFDPDCEDEFFCNTEKKKCEKKRKENFDCGASTPCGDGLFCHEKEKKCKKEGSEGFVCRIFEGLKISEEKECNDDLICNGKSHKCRKKSKKDDICSFSRDCEDGLICFEKEYKCKEVGEGNKNDICDTRSIEGCKDGLVCDIREGVCKEREVSSTTNTNNKNSAKTDQCTIETQETDCGPDKLCTMLPNDTVNTCQTQDAINSAKMDIDNPSVGDKGQSDAINPDPNADPENKPANLAMDTDVDFKELPDTPDAKPGDMCLINLPEKTPCEPGCDKCGEGFECKVDDNTAFVSDDLEIASDKEPLNCTVQDFHEYYVGYPQRPNFLEEIISGKYEKHMEGGSDTDKDKTKRNMPDGNKYKSGADSNKAKENAQCAKNRIIYWKENYKKEIKGCADKINMECVRAMQKYFEIDEDGMIGPNTSKKLNGKIPEGKCTVVVDKGIGEEKTACSEDEQEIVENEGGDCNDACKICSSDKGLQCLDNEGKTISSAKNNDDLEIASIKTGKCKLIGLNFLPTDAFVSSRLPGPKEEGARNKSYFSHYFLPNVTKIVLRFSGTFALLFVIIGGLQMVVGGVNSEGFAAGRKTITWALLGLIITMLSYAAVAIFNTIFSSSV